MKIKILHQNCDPELANDRKLPTNSYLVEYETEGSLQQDIVICSKVVDIFDYYWDNYRQGLKGWKQTEGRVNPKLWGSKPKEEKKRR